MKLGEWIKEYRKEHGISMQVMADMCGFSKAYVGMLEKGINPTTKRPISPTMQTFQKIADGVGIDVNDLIKLLDNDQPITLTVNNSTSTPDNSSEDDFFDEDIRMLARKKMQDASPEERERKKKLIHDLIKEML